jgi:hypothetical protein
MTTKLVMAAAAFVLAACGGGGGDDNNAPPVSTVSAAGQYIGTVNNRQTTALVMDDGRFYTQYSVAGQPNLIAGVVAGTVSSTNGTLSNGHGIDYNLEGQGTNNIALTGSYVAKKSINATVTYATGANSTLNGTYDTTYDTVPTLAAVTGTYRGTSAVPGVGNDTVTLTASATGVITGQGTNCGFAGTIRPHASGNVYDITLTFGTGSGCAFPNTSATGIGVLSNSNTVIHAFVQTPANKGILFLGAK